MDLSILPTDLVLEIQGFVIGDDWFVVGKNADGKPCGSCYEARLRREVCDRKGHSFGSVVIGFDEFCSLEYCQKNTLLRSIVVSGFAYFRMMVGEGGLRKCIGSKEFTRSVLMNPSFRNIRAGIFDDF